MALLGSCIPAALCLVAVLFIAMHSRRQKKAKGRGRLKSSDDLSVCETQSDMSYYSHAATAQSASEDQYSQDSIPIHHDALHESHAAHAKDCSLDTDTGDDKTLILLVFITVKSVLTVTCL
jgi:hypothetical protein